MNKNLKFKLPMLLITAVVIGGISVESYGIKAKAGDNNGKTVVVKALAQPKSTADDKLEIQNIKQIQDKDLDDFNILRHGNQIFHEIGNENYTMFLHEDLNYDNGNYKANEKYAAGESAPRLSGVGEDEKQQQKMNTLPLYISLYEKKTDKVIKDFKLEKDGWRYHVERAEASADGNKVVFVGTKYKPEADHFNVTESLYMIDFNKPGEIVTLKQGESEGNLFYNADFDANGNVIYSYFDKNTRGLCMYDMKNGTTSNLVDDWVDAFRLSEDGTKIAYSTDKDADNSANVYAAQIKGDNLTNVISLCKDINVEQGADQNFFWKNNDKTLEIQERYGRRGHKNFEELDCYNYFHGDYTKSAKNNYIINFK